MLNYKIFDGFRWGVSAVAKYVSGVHFQEIDHCGFGETLTAANVRNAIKQIIDHVNDSEELITPLDMAEPAKVEQVGGATFLAWSSPLSGLNDSGKEETLILLIEIDRHDN